MNHKPNKDTWEIVDRSDTQVTIHAMCICGGECGWVATVYPDTMFNGDGVPLG